MAAFCTTFHSMLKHDIKHTYYGKPISMTFRGNEYPNLDQMRKSMEERDMKQRVLRGKTTVYRNYSIPAAPAFRLLSRHEVDDIIVRLRKSTIASDGPEASADERQMAKIRRENPKFAGQKKVKPEDLGDIDNRLCSMNHMARLRAERNPYNQAIVINGKIPSDSLWTRKMTQGRYRMTE